MFSDPERNIEQAGLIDGNVVADLGAGSGFYSLAAAKAVAPHGKVYAVDVQRDLLDRLKREANRLHIRNIDVIAGDLERLGGSKIRDLSVDAAIVSNTLFMIEDKKSMLLEAARILKKRGKLVLIEWSGSFGQMGPHPGHVVYKDEAMKLALAAGFEFDREFGAGAHHYGIIFRKQ